MWLLMKTTMAWWEIIHMSETEGEKAEITKCWPSTADSEITMVTAGQTTNSLLLVSIAWSIITYGWIILL